MEVIVHEMSYCGQDVRPPDIQCVPFDESYAEEYIEAYNACFFDMRKALDIQPYSFYSDRAQLAGKEQDIFLLLGQDGLIGSVACRGNEIDDLIVTKAYQRRGYGTLLLH